jgi:hypothetical protein
MPLPNRRCDSGNGIVGFINFHDRSASTQGLARPGTVDCTRLERIRQPDFGARPSTKMERLVIDKNTHVPYKV